MLGEGIQALRCTLLALGGVERRFALAQDGVRLVGHSTLFSQAIFNGKTLITRRLCLLQCPVNGLALLVDARTLMGRAIEGNRGRAVRHRGRRRRRLSVAPPGAHQQNPHP